MPRPESNPRNPYVPQYVEWEEGAPPIELHVLEEDARSVLTENDSPDVGFRWSVNPYRGCQHACAYCYARPTHQYLGLGAGTDFDTRIAVKRNAPEVLALELARSSWRRERVAFSGITDCYQPLESRYELTRRCLEVCFARATPVHVITKSAIARRDADLLARHSRELGSAVYVSIPFADAELARAIEPFAPTPALRFETLRVLAAAGVTCGVMLAPTVPGLSDDQIPRVLEAAARAGATRAGHVALRLPMEVAPVFEERLRATLPLRADKVLHAIEDIRGGKRNESRFGARMRGVGPRWKMIDQLFELHCRRLGLNVRSEPAVRSQLPAKSKRASSEPRGQLGLFD